MTRNGTRKVLVRGEEEASEDTSVASPSDQAVVGTIDSENNPPLRIQR